MRDIGVCSQYFDDFLSMLNLAVDNVLVRASNLISQRRIVDHVKRFFPVTTKEGPVINNLNCRIIQSDCNVSLY